MIRNATFSPDLSLASLQAQLRRFEALWGTLTIIDNQGGSTIGVYDNAHRGNRKIVLKPGEAGNLPGTTVIATGKVFIVGQLQTVTAYREP